jgi:hypothetical protein
LRERLVLCRDLEGLRMRYPGEFLVEGRKCKDATVLPATACVSGDTFAFAVEPVAR